MPNVTPAQTKVSHERRRAKGWHRLHYWISPEAQAAIERKKLPGETRTQTIERLILATEPTMTE